MIPESGSKQGMHLKILAEIDLNRPLLSGTKVKCSNQEAWVDFKYENMGLFYFYCGLVGHVERSCWEGDAKKGQILEDQYGEWLRADQRMRALNSATKNLRKEKKIR